MYYLRANKNGLIEVISVENIINHTCVIEKLPSDFYKYLSDGKYIVENNELKIKEGWTDFNFKISIPTYLILDNTYLKQLINYCDINNVKYEIDKTSGNAFVYVLFINPQHLDLFNMINNINGEEIIKIEERF